MLPTRAQLSSALEHCWSSSPAVTTQPLRTPPSPRVIRQLGVTIPAGYKTVVPRDSFAPYSSLTPSSPRRHRRKREPAPPCGGVPLRRGVIRTVPDPSELLARSQFGSRNTTATLTRRGILGATSIRRRSWPRHRSAFPRRHARQCSDSGT